MSSPVLSVNELPPTPLKLFKVLPASHAPEMGGYTAPHDVYDHDKAGFYDKLVGEEPPHVVSSSAERPDDENSSFLKEQPGFA